MKYVQLFEEFDASVPAAIEPAASTFMYIVHNSSEKDFHAEVKDQDGKVIFEIKGSGLFEGDLIKGKDDITGLREFLISKKLIKEGDQLIKAGDGGQEMQSFIQPVDTNPVLNLNMMNNASQNQNKKDENGKN